MRGEQLEQAEITERGLFGDRAHALIDTDTGKVVSAKSVRLFPDLFGCQAGFVEPRRSGRELPPVRIVLPDGTSVTSDSGDVDRVLSAYFKRDVTLARAAPEDFTIDQYHPDVEDLEDTDILRTLARHNRVRVGDAGQFPCAGVYAVVAAPGTMSVVGKSHEIGTEQLAWLAKPEPEVLIIAGGWRELAGSGLEPSVFSRLAPHPDGIRGDRARRRYHT